MNCPSKRRCEHDAVTRGDRRGRFWQLDIVPAKIQVLRHIRKQYACDCGQCIKTAPLPAQPIEYGLAGAHYSVRVRRCVRPSGEQRICGYPPSDAGELDDQLVAAD